MVGLQTLNLAIGVRVPASQPNNLQRFLIAGIQGHNTLVATSPTRKAERFKSAVCRLKYCSKGTFVEQSISKGLQDFPFLCRSLPDVKLIFALTNN